jgi:hypothetical protein
MTMRFFLSTVNREGIHLRVVRALAVRSFAETAAAATTSLVDLTTTFHREAAKNAKEGVTDVRNAVKATTE